MKASRYDDIAFFTPFLAFFAIYFLLSEFFTLFGIHTWITFDEPRTMMGGGGRTSYEYESSGDFTYYGIYSILMGFVLSRKLYVWLYNKYVKRQEKDYNNTRGLFWGIGLTIVITIRLLLDVYINLNYIFENVLFLIISWVILRKVYTKYGASGL